MAACVNGRACNPKSQGRSESRREHEFYRFYEPIRGMTKDGPTYCDVRDAKSREIHVPFSCPDKTLTAFCQLGALRFNVRRCLLFFFDVNYAYIMAEATRSLSLEDDNAHDPGDQLWLGHAKIPRGIACCEWTVGLPSFPITVTTKNGDRDSIYVVEDLTKNLTTQDKPYVTSFPHGRFYAGVPITGPNGINIGAYCVLGDEPRDGVSDKDLIFLRDMSRTVMTHLETIRAQAERQRATQMVTGLGSFVKRSSDTRRWERRNLTQATQLTSATIKSLQSPSHRGPPSDSKHSVPAKRLDDTKTSAPDAKFSSSGSNVAQAYPGAQERVTASPELFNEDVFGTVTPLASEQTGSSSQGFPIPGDAHPEQESPRLQTRGSFSSSGQIPAHHGGSTANIRSAYQRAAEIMKSSLSVDGVAFLDASVRTFGGLAEAVDNTETTDFSNDSESASARSRSASPTSDENNKPCRVLASVGTTQDGEELSAKTVNESFLRQLLRRHPHGKIWSFGGSGQAHSEDLTSSSSENDELHNSESSVLLTPGAQQRKRRLREVHNDGQVLASMFPGARSVAIHGIRDSGRRRWTAGCLLWSFDPLRVLTIDTEMNFVAAFCDIIAGETRSLEVQRSDRAKSDFISSISHELRSPLHGILGSTEVLAELDLDSTVSTLAGQIDSCGRTLLDIIDHLLDFATLKGQRLKKGVASSSRIGHRISARERKASADDDIADLETSVSLDDLTEEAAESTVYSFLCKKGASYEPRASVILDIDRSRGVKWHCKLATGGWRRVCINLVTNALKYTPSGYIRVSLAQKPRAGSRRHFDAILTVSDTGKGMSKEFLENQLFRDFTQEDTLADGIGLGMHMVGRILHAIGGTIEVSSDQHGDQAGTSITVTVPLEHSQNARNTNNTSDEEISSLRGSLTGLKAGIFGHETSLFPSESREKKLQAAASAMTMTSIEDSCRYLGLQSQKGESADCDLTFYLEEDFERSRDAGRIGSETKLKGKPCIVVCRSTPLTKTLKALRSRDITRTGRVVEYVGLPCGVKSISRAISSALQRQKEFESSAPERNVEEQMQRLSTAAEIANVEEIELPPSIHPIPQPEEDLPIRPKFESKFESFPTFPDDQDQMSPGAAPKTLIQQEKRPETPVQIKTQIITQTKTQTPKDTDTSTNIPATRQSTTTTKTPTLLLVDDNKVNLQLLTMYAKKRKYPYLEAMDGQQAVNAYQKAHEDSTSPSSVTTTSGAQSPPPSIPAIILMDINMPVMDGYEATQRIRSYEKKHQIPASKIIALTALGSEAAYKEAFGSGCDMFLTKPVKLKDLTKIIEGGGESA